MTRRYRILTGIDTDGKTPFYITQHKRDFFSDWERYGWGRYDTPDRDKYTRHKTLESAEKLIHQLKERHACWDESDRLDAISKRSIRVLKKL